MLDKDFLPLMPYLAFDETHLLRCLIFETMLELIIVYGYDQQLLELFW